MDKLTAIANSFIEFINSTLVPLVFAVAFIVFLFGVFRYFILGGANEESRKSGRQLIIYSIVGFAVMIVVWGLVNLIVGTFGFTDNTRPDLPTFAAPTNPSASHEAGHTTSPTSDSTPTPSPLPDTTNDSNVTNPYDSVGPGIITD